MENTKLELSNGEVVSIVPFLTWGQKEEINNCYVKGAKVGVAGMSDFDTSVIGEAKSKLLETCIKGIEKDGVNKEFSMDWINNLSCEDGDLVFDTVNNLTKKKEVATISK